MKTKKMLLLISVAMLFASAANAQRVIESVNILIDCRNMHESVYNKVNRTLAEKREEVLKTQASNKKVAKLFYVDYEDTTFRLGGVSTTSTWSRAMERGCTGDGRLPTQREMMLIWILSKKLDDGHLKTGQSSYYKALSGIYWCATENDDNNAYVLNVDNGTVYSASKTTQNKTRCITEKEK